MFKHSEALQLLQPMGVFWSQFAHLLRPFVPSSAKYTGLWWDTAGAGVSAGAGAVAPAILSSNTRVSRNTFRLAPCVPLHGLVKYAIVADQCIGDVHSTHMPEWMKTYIGNIIYICIKIGNMSSRRWYKENILVVVLRSWWNRNIGQCSLPIATLDPAPDCFLPMGCVDCWAHQHVSCVPPLYEQPPSGPPGRSSIQCLRPVFGVTNAVWVDGTTCPDLLLQEVTEKGRISVEMVHKPFVTCAKHPCGHNWDPFLLQQHLLLHIWRGPFRESARTNSL